MVLDPRLISFIILIVNPKWTLLKVLGERSLWVPQRYIQIADVGAKSHAKSGSQTCRTMVPIALTTRRAAVRADRPSMSAGG